MARTPLVAGMVLLVLGGAAAGYALTRQATGGMTPELTKVMEDSITQLDTDIQSARAQVQARAELLAQVGEVRASIGTDADTTKDRLGREVAFQPQAGEVLELTQVPKAGGPMQPLFMIPPDGMRSSHDAAAGSFVELHGDQVLVTQVAAVTTSQTDAAAQQLTGFVTVSRPLSLAKATAGLGKAGVKGDLEIDGQKYMVGPPVPNGTTQIRPLHSVPNARFVASVAPAANGTPVGVLAAGGAGASLGLVLVLIGMMGGKRKAGARAVARDIRYSDTKLSQPPGIAGGTPTPVTAGGAAISPNDLGPGAMVGRWEILRRIGSGGMADVFLAHSKGEAGFEKLVALKVMHPHLARNERAVEHFLDEARLAARVHHPNVVAIHDLGKIGADYVIAMEYVEGVDLERLLAGTRATQRPVPINVGLGILCRICDGLHAAHTATSTDGTPLNIVHRDVKSANVLVSRQGSVKVVDFGIAKATSQVHMTVAGETKGTPSMMAPEQRIGEHVDVRADVYSVGAVAYELLTNNGVNLDLAALAHLGVENWPHLPLPSTLRGDLPVELDSLLLRAMSFEREKRPPDCATFEDLFEGVMKKYGLSASDKEISRWVEGELSRFPPEQMPASASAVSKPSGFA